MVTSHNCFTKRKDHVYCIGMTSMGTKLAHRYRGIVPIRFAKEMMMALFGCVHINMHIAMIDYTWIIARDGPVPVAYDY